MLAAAGLKPSDFIAPPPVEIWPDHAGALSLFIRNYTQWRVGSGGPVGLDYAVLYQDMRLRRVRRRDQVETMDLLRVIERAALETLHKS
ncbi:DUF1799 domain-containing protein [Achromobacter marplatensis]|uniref:DUF1799 domain-containing protein n=1 Tax=Achromobacter marplatensis TaxID=470868 RepID=A0AA43B2C5_9BURK|nr:DUF1799 domain-containing protein [Achromobacter marplatensis]MDH2052850.1 DUF1799 domain-containing protein [Achromobacter marplatensis]